MVVDTGTRAQVLARVTEKDALGERRTLGVAAVRILVIGGTGFIGSRVVARLCALEHQIAVFHRGTPLAPTQPHVPEIRGDESELLAFRDRFAAFAPDVVINMILGAEAEAQRFVLAIRGIAARGVVISSMDVYRAYDRYRRKDPGPPDPVPLREEGPLRDRLYPYLPDGESPTPDEYDKILVERIVSAEPALPCTVLRLPMVYGPGDRQHRFHAWLKRMQDGRPAILLDAARANWRATFGHIADVADAIVLAATDPRATGRTYNVGEPRAWTAHEWIERLGGAVAWKGKVATLPSDALPAHLVLDRDFRQDWVVDTTRIRTELGFVERTDPGGELRGKAGWELAHAPEDLDAAAFDYAAEDEVLRTLQQTGSVPGE